MIYRTRAAANRWWFAILLTLLGSYLVLNVILIASNYFTGDGITDAVIYTVTSSLKGAGISKYAAVYHSAGGVGAYLRGAGPQPAAPQGQRQQRGLQRRRRAACAVFGRYHPGVSGHLAAGQEPDRRRYRRFHHLLQGAEKTVQGKRPNLVYIYAESLERTYFDTELFPGLADELNALRTDSIDFSNTQQLPGTGYTIAGMVASQCGIPLFAPFDGNASSAVSTFYPENVCLGDVLKAAGYSNYFYQGAELAFAGKDTFLKSHGFDHVYGFKELREQVADPSYKTTGAGTTTACWTWCTVSSSSCPNSANPLAAHPDRRHPSPGRLYLRRLQQKSYAWQNKENRSLSAVACSQQHIAALIDKIKRSPYFSNTVIVVSSDHLAMNNTAYDILTKQKRRNLFFIIDGTRPLAEQRNEKRSTLDNGATVLDVMGGDNYIGLGRSSLSAPSLSTVFLNIEEKINGWKPAVINQWGLPNRISDYSVDTRRRSFSFSGVTYKVPFILRVGDNRIEPMFNVYLSTPLRKQLAGLGRGEIRLGR